MAVEAADLVMIGAGMASTSLALALINSGYQGRMVMLEASRQINTKKNWCFWDTGTLPDYLKPLCCKRWYRWQTSTPTEQHIMTAACTPYCCIRAEDFYSYAQDRFACGDVDVRLNCTATKVAATSNAVVSTKDGLVQARYGVDCSFTQKQSEGLIQSFYGAWVVSKQTLFNTNVVGLMEDMQVVDEQLQFIYRLPVTPQLSLIEVTRFAAVCAPLSVLRQPLDDYLATRLPKDSWRIESTEQGQLPMQVMPRQQRGGAWVKAGISGGHLRASTGYGFLPVQHWSQHAARALIHGTIATIRESPITRQYHLMDRLLLTVLRKNIALAPELFQTLAKRCNPEPFARFMTEAATVKDLLEIVNAMPKKHFLKSLLRWPG